jgi:hypothetical protein
MPVGGCEVRHAVMYALPDEHRETLCMTVLRLLAPLLPRGDRRLGDSKQGAELGLGVAQPSAGGSDVFWLHYLVRCPPSSYQHGYIVAVDDKYL